MLLLNHILWSGHYLLEMVKLGGGLLFWGSFLNLCSASALHAYAEDIFQTGPVPSQPRTFPYFCSLAFLQPQVPHKGALAYIKNVFN